MADAKPNCRGKGDVRFGSLADITARSRHVRFTRASGHSSMQVGCPKSANSRHEPRASVTVRSLFDRRQDGRTLVLDEDHEKFRRIRVACVATDNMNVAGAFVEGPTRLKGDRFLPLDLHDDGAL